MLEPTPLDPRAQSEPTNLEFELAKKDSTKKQFVPTELRTYNLSNWREITYNYTMKLFINSCRLLNIYEVTPHQDRNKEQKRTKNLPLAKNTKSIVPGKIRT